MRDRTFKKQTLLSAFKEAGLVPISPDIIVARLQEFEPTPPEGQPFQHPPLTRDREAHSKYLDRRIEDHINGDIPLTPSFVRSWRAFNASTEPKIIKAKLIQERDTTNCGGPRAAPTQRREQFLGSTVCCNIKRTSIRSNYR